MLKAVRTTEIFVTKNISNNSETPDSVDTIFPSLYFRLNK